MVVFGQKRLYSGKSGCNRAKVVVFRQSWYIRSKTVVFGQSGCIRSKVVVIVQIASMRAMFFLFGQN